MEKYSLVNTWTDEVQQATFYEVDCDGEIATIKRLHFPKFGNKPLAYVMEPVPENVNTKEVMDFLYSAVPEDFRTYYLERRWTYSFAPVIDACYSREQALYLAQKIWDEEKDKTKLITLEVGYYTGPKLAYVPVKNFLKSA